MRDRDHYVFPGRVLYHDVAVNIAGQRFHNMPAMRCTTSSTWQVGLKQVDLKQPCYLIVTITISHAVTPITTEAQRKEHRGPL